MLNKLSLTLVGFLPVIWLSNSYQPVVECCGCTPYTEYITLPPGGQANAVTWDITLTPLATGWCIEGVGECVQEIGCNFTGSLVKFTNNLAVNIEVSVPGGGDHFTVAPGEEKEYEIGAGDPGANLSCGQGGWGVGLNFLVWLFEAGRYAPKEALCFWCDGCFICG